MQSIITIGNDGYHYSAGYYTTNKWIDNDTVVLARSHDRRIVTTADVVELVALSLKDGSMKVLCNDVWDFADYVVHGSTVYYTDGQSLKSVDAQTGECRRIYTYQDEFHHDADTLHISMPHITADGKTISLFVPVKDRASLFFTVDTQSGISRKLCTKKFNPPFTFANHGMICPTDPDLLFFAHEGTTFYISNRLWIYNAKTDEMHTIATQHLNETGDLGDCYGHEMWAPDGKGLYFVKYSCSPTPPCGIRYVDIETNTTEILYSTFKYWHVGVSADGKYLVSDTQKGDGQSEVILINRETGEEKWIDTAKTDWVHPCHPHPQLSPDNRHILYTAMSESGNTCTKIATVE